MDYLIIFLEGVITFISPCMLPMLPVYVLYFAAGESKKRGTLLNALGFVLGFTLVFMLMGIFAGTLGSVLRGHQQALDIASGAIMVLFGLHFTGVFTLPFLNASKHLDAGIRATGFLRCVLFGVVLSLGWTPCAGAFLGSALLLAASSQNAATGIIMLFTYSMGLGIPFVLSALLLNQLKQSFDFIKKHYKAVNLISGGFLVLVGVLMMSGVLGGLLRSLSS